MPAFAGMTEKRLIPAFLFNPNPDKPELNIDD
jgi:hypothetical protein